MKGRYGVAMSKALFAYDGFRELARFRASDPTLLREGAPALSAIVIALLIAVGQKAVGKNLRLAHAKQVEPDADGRRPLVDRELSAIDAYEAAKTGKAPAATRRGTRARPLARRGSKREALMQVIKDNPSGLTRGEILERMGLKGDKSGEMSVSNALTALTKGKQVARKDRKYVAA